jgi:hypothetical protein
VSTALGRALVLACLACGCTAAGGATEPDEPQLPRPDESALEIETEVRARFVELILSDRWREELTIEGINVERPSEDRLQARGSVVLTLKNLRVEASDTLEVRFLPDHEDLLLHAKQVALFRQHKGYGHRTENVAAATMANEHVSFWQQP